MTPYRTIPHAPGLLWVDAGPRSVVVTPRDGAPAAFTDLRQLVRFVRVMLAAQARETRDD